MADRIRPQTRTKVLTASAADALAHEPFLTTRSSAERVFHAPKTEVKSMSNLGTPTPESLADDTLKGVVAIAAFLGEPVRRTSYLLERKLVPAGQVGRAWYASKRVLREHRERVVRGEC